jgi:ATP-binding cassette subfamily B protein
VKYFNAEEHEEDRFEKALVEYKAKSIEVAQGLVSLNIGQTTVICIGLGCTLALAQWFIDSKKLTVGGFVMFNSYNMQIYAPLSFLGTLWRMMR